MPRLAIVIENHDTEHHAPCALDEQSFQILVASPVRVPGFTVKNFLRPVSTFKPVFLNMFKNTANKQQTVAVSAVDILFSSKCVKKELFKTSIERIM